MERYGIDKPDLRFGFEIRDLTRADRRRTRPRSCARRVAAGGRLRGIVAPGGAALSRKELDALDGRGQGGQGRRADLGAPHGGGLGRAGGQGDRRRRCSTPLGGTDGDLLLAVAGRRQR